MNTVQQSAAALRDILLDMHDGTIRAQETLFALDLSDDPTGKADCLRRTFIRKAAIDGATLMTLAHIADGMTELGEDREQPAW